MKLPKEITIFEITPSGIDDFYFKCIECEQRIIKYGYLHGFLKPHNHLIFEFGGFVSGAERIVNGVSVLKCPNCHYDFEMKFDECHMYIPQDKLILF